MKICSKCGHRNWFEEKIRKSCESCGKSFPCDDVKEHPEGIIKQTNTGNIIRESAPVQSDERGNWLDYWSK